ncbi:hypothetical protein J5U23_00900 [Saccharolobus shibatae B12]|uniref:Uncharacterized protein n=2 Tax=Saccharolobus shibatae TaxID=2286 RepID=A0A8F5BZV5_9CREN|nr:hypothetical protein J5U23_00900 [Saccharolobus shibatae B12]QXJ31355.1 hypothetical protein J5U21_01005 [Saccharolobus shibatae]QXJ34373.1 hypothetical protein J5U22_00919 [Saccharolobus shibatae]
MPLFPIKLYLGFNGNRLLRLINKILLINLIALEEFLWK